MWGFHDRLLTLRKALHSLLTSGDIWPAIYRRWRFQSHLYNTQFGLIMSEAEWEDEWKSVLKLASTEPRNMVVESSQRRRSRMSIIGSVKDLDSQGESSSASSTASTGITFRIRKQEISFERNSLKFTSADLQCRSILHIGYFARHKSI